MHNSVFISNKIKISWAERLGGVCCFNFYLEIHTYLSWAHNTSNIIHTQSIIEADILENSDLSREGKTIRRKNE